MAILIPTYSETARSASLSRPHEEFILEQSLLSAAYGQVSFACNFRELAYPQLERRIAMPSLSPREFREIAEFLCM